MDKHNSVKEQQKQTKRLLFTLGGVLYFFVFWFTLHMGTVYDGTEKNPLDVASKAATHILAKPLAILPTTEHTFIYVFVGAFIFWLIFLYLYTIEKQRFSDKEVGGTAKWHDDLKGYNKKYTAPFGRDKTAKGYWHNPTHIEDNVILAKDLYLSMNGRKTRRTIHQAVFGGSGTGKSYSLVKPNGLQMNSNYIFTDPKGELLEELAHPLEEAGYEIKVFNLTDMKKSLCYNPYHYIRDEKGVRSMVNCIIENTKKEGSSSGDQIWDDSMTVLLQAISFYMMETLPEEECNFGTAMDLIRLAEVDENNTSAKSQLDNLFDSLEAENKKAGKPESMATKCYKEFRIASGKTLKSILITTLTRLDVFNYEDVKNLTSTDSIHLEELGRKKQALFIIIPAADKTFNFLAATLYTQLFETLYYQVENEFPVSYLYQKDNETYLVSSNEDDLKKKVKLLPDAKVRERDGRFEVYAEDVVLESFLTKQAAEWFLFHATGGKIVRGKRTLPYDVRFILDEFANVGKIPGFVEKLSTMRSYRIWCMIILQNLAQLKKMWDDDMGTIVGNCDVFTFLGSQEKEMIEYIQTMLGSTTKRQQNTSISSSKQGKISESYQETKANLLDFNEIREMDDDDCITFIRGLKPFYMRKYNLEEHPSYKLSGTYSDNNKYYIPYDNSKKEDITRDKKKITSTRKKCLKEELDRGEDHLISEPENIVDIMSDVSGGEKEKLTNRIEVSDSSLQSAINEQEKELANRQLAEAEEEMENTVPTQDIWSMMM